MASLNRVVLIGHLGADPDLKTTATGRSLCNLKVATEDVWKDKAGQRQEKTEWHRITVWGQQAETCGKYLKKGRQVYIEGSLETRTWDDKDGNKRFSTEVRADKVLFLGGKDAEQPEPRKPVEREPGVDDDLAF